MNYAETSITELAHYTLVAFGYAWHHPTASICAILGLWLYLKFENEESVFRLWMIGEFEIVLGDIFMIDIDMIPSDRWWGMLLPALIFSGVCWLIDYNEKHPEIYPGGKLPDPTA